MIDFDLAKELYHREIDGKTALDTKLNTHLLILSFLAGALYFLFKTGISLKTIPDVTKVASGSLAIILYLLGLCFVLRAALPRHYETIASAADLSSFHDDLMRYHEGSGTDVDEDFRRSVVPRLVSAASRARFNNLTRSAHYYFASLFFASALILTVIAGGACVYPSVRACILEGGGSHVQGSTSTAQTECTDSGEAKAGGAEEHHPPGE